MKGAELAQTRGSSEETVHPVRLGLGDYTRPGSEHASLAVRKLFVEHLDREAAQVREALRRLIDITDEKELESAINAWATRFRLLLNGKPPRWIRQTARSALRI